MKAGLSGNERVDNTMANWVVRGGVGWVNMLLFHQREGLVFPETAEQDLLYICAVLRNIYLRNNNLPEEPLPAPATAFVAENLARWMRTADAVPPTSVPEDRGNQ